MSPGILEMLRSVTTLIFAIPIAYAGAELLFRGDHIVGVALLGVALAMVVADRYVTTLSDLPVVVVSKLVDAAVLSPDEE